MLDRMTEENVRGIAKVLEIAGMLKRIQRTGWVDAEVYQSESVADHTFRTAFLCMLYADMQGLDPLKLLRMALIHDLPEAIIGDLTPKQKMEETKENEEQAMLRILCILPKMEREKYLAVWNEYQEGKTKEADAVRQLEKIEMALQAKEYKKLSSTNKSLKRFVESAQDVTVWPDLKRLLSYIVEEK
jgi:putative hydrolase of HD superfamily